MICIISINVIGLDASLYVVANASILLFVLAIAAMVFSNGGRLKAGRAFFIPLAVFIYFALSALWASDHDAAFSQLRTQILLLALCISVYIACRSFPTICKAYMQAIYISAYLMIGYSFIVYGGINGFISTLNSMGRVGGIINGENGFGLLFAEGSIAAIYFLLFEKKKHGIIAIVLFPIFAFTSGSKKAVLFILVGLTVMLIFRYGIKRLYKVLIAVWIMIGVGYYIINLPTFNVLNARIDAFLGGTSLSDSIRERMISRGLELVKEGNFLLGYGIDNYRVVSGFNLYSHNNYIEALVGLGIIGSLLYYSMYITGIKATISACKYSDVYKGFLVLLGLYVIMEYGMVTMYSKEIWVLLGIALAIADGAINITEQKQTN